MTIQYEVSKLANGIKVTGWIVKDGSRQGCSVECQAEAETAAKSAIRGILLG